MNNSKKIAGLSPARLDKLKKGLLGLLILIIFVESLPIRWSMRETGNEIEIGPQASSEPLTIPMDGLVSGSFLSKANLTAIRSQALAQFPMLFSGRYAPISALTGSISDELPWVSKQDYYYFGFSLTSTANTLEGPPAEDLSLANPYLLLRPEFLSWSIRGDGKWDTTKISESDLQRPDFPFYPIPSLKWWPAEARAEATYNLSQFKALIDPLLTAQLPAEKITFNVVGYNAADLGFGSLRLSQEHSANVEGPKTSATLPIYSRLASQGNFNTRVQMFDQILLAQALSLPATAVFELWKDTAPAVDQPADMTFSIVLQ